MTEDEETQGTRRGDGIGQCYQRHHEWSEDWWRDHGDRRAKEAAYHSIGAWWRDTGTGNVRNIVIYSVAGIAAVAVGLMLWIASVAVAQSGHATKAELKQMEKTMVSAMQASAMAHAEAMQRVVDRMFEDRRGAADKLEKYERRLDNLREILLTIPGAKPIPVPE